MLIINEAIKFWLANTVKTNKNLKTKSWKRQFKMQREIIDNMIYLFGKWWKVYE